MKKVILILVIALVPFAANAEWVGGFGYFDVSDDESGIDISHGSITGSLGYRINSDSRFTIMPEFRAGIGVGDDTVLGFDVDLDRILVFSVRGQYDFESGMYLFAEPSYANVKYTLSVSDFPVIEGDDWEFGFGGGAGYRFSEQVMGELSWETFDGADVIGGALKFSFGSHN